MLPFNPHLKTFPAIKNKLRGEKNFSWEIDMEVFYFLALAKIVTHTLLFFLKAVILLIAHVFSSHFWDF